MGRKPTRKATPRTISAAERQAQALKLRAAGATFEQIAHRLEYSDRGAAHHAVQAALRRVVEEPAEEVLRLELGRLDAMLVGLWGKATKGDPAAVDRVLRVMERRARYLGLDAPERSKVEVSTAEPEVVERIRALKADG